MKLRLSVLKPAAVSAITLVALLHAGVGMAQPAAGPSQTQSVYFAPVGSTTTGTLTFEASTGRSFSLDVIYDDDSAGGRSVVSLGLHWDSTKLTLGGVTGVASLADPVVPAGATFPAGVSQTVSQVGGAALANTDNLTGVTAAAAMGSRALGGTDDNDADTNMVLLPAWGQIFGDVFTGDDAVKLMTVSFTWADGTVAGATSKINFTSVGGGDYQARMFSGTPLTVVATDAPAFSFNVDGSSNPVPTLQDVTLIARYALGVTTVVAGLTTGTDVTGSDAVQAVVDAVQAGIDAGVLNVDGDGGNQPTVADVTLVARYLLGVTSVVAGLNTGVDLTADQLDDAIASIKLYL